MTLAICIQCGKQKRGAFVWCSCGFTPTSPLEKAKSLALSDRSMSANALHATAERIAAGSAPTFDDAELARLADLIARQPSSKQSLGCTIAVWLLLATLIGLAVFVVLLFAYFIPRAS